MFLSCGWCVRPDSYAGGVPDRTNATATTAGVLRPDEFARHVGLVRDPAGEAVAPWVENHWALRWDLPEGRFFTSEVLPHPTCSLTLELGTHPRPALPPGERLVVTGVCTRRFDVEVRGHGRVLGLRFRPGGLAALTGRPATGWADRSVPAHGLLPDALAARLDDPALAADPARWRAEAEAGPRRARPRPRRPVRRAAARRRRDARGPLARHRCRRGAAARDVGPQPPATLRPLRRRGPEVGARPVPDARRPRHPRRRVRGHPHRPRARATAGTTRPTSPATSPRSWGSRPGAYRPPARAVGSTAARVAGRCPGQGGTAPSGCRFPRM